MPVWIVLGKKGIITARIGPAEGAAGVADDIGIAEVVHRHGTAEIGKAGAGLAQPSRVVGVIGQGRGG